MSLYGGIDLHANNSVAVLLNEQDQVIYHPSLKSQGTHRPAQDGKTRTIKRASPILPPNIDTRI